MGGEELTLDVQAAAGVATPFSRIGGTDVVLGLLGQQISGDFSFADDAAGVEVTDHRRDRKLGGGVVQATGADATFTIESSPKQLAASITATPR